VVVDEHNAHRHVVTVEGGPTGRVGMVPPAQSPGRGMAVAGRREIVE
jgi:hypothetical protein